MKVKNSKCIRRLAWKTLQASRTRNLIAAAAIALTAVLFTSQFTIALSINEGIQQSNFRQVGGWSHGGFKYLTEQQFDALKDDPLIDAWGLRRFLGMPTDAPFNKSHVEVSYADANEAHWMYCDPVDGALPQEGTDQAATDTHVLELLGIEPEIGAEFTLTFPVDGHTTTQTFTLSGWWEYDEAIVANHILIPESRLNEILSECGVDPNAPSDGMTGTWNMDLMLKNGSRRIEQDLNQILSNHGYQSETQGENYIDTGVNWGYTGARMSDSMDPTVFLAITAIALLIIFTGYLIIYNVFQISVAGDIRFYGLSLLLFQSLQKDLRQADEDQKPAEQLPQRLGVRLLGQQRAAHGAHGSGSRRRPDGRPDDLAVFDMKDQRTGGAGQEVQQIHTLRRSLLHGQDSGHPDHQQASAADAEPGQHTTDQPREDGTAER